MTEYLGMVLFLQEYVVDGQLLGAIKSLYWGSEVCAKVNVKQLKPFRMGIGLRQGCSCHLSFS